METKSDLQSSTTMSLNKSVPNNTGDIKSVFSILISSYQKINDSM